MSTQGKPLRAVFERSSGYCGEARAPADVICVRGRTPLGCPGDDICYVAHRLPHRVCSHPAVLVRSRPVEISAGFPQNLQLRLQISQAQPLLEQAQPLQQGPTRQPHFKEAAAHKRRAHWQDWGHITERSVSSSPSAPGSDAPMPSNSICVGRRSVADMAVVGEIQEWRNFPWR